MKWNSFKHIMAMWQCGRCKWQEAIRVNCLIVARPQKKRSHSGRPETGLKAKYAMLLMPDRWLNLNLNNMQHATRSSNMQQCSNTKNYHKMLPQNCKSGKLDVPQYVAGRQDWFASESCLLFAFVLCCWCCLFCCCNCNCNEIGHELGRYKSVACNTVELIKARRWPRKVQVFYFLCHQNPK